MPLPAYGFPGHAFVASRFLQILSLLVTIGLTSHCTWALLHASIGVPGRLIGYLTISCLGTVYAAFSLVLYVDSQLPLLLSAICDGFFVFAFVTLSILVGENVANLSCRASDMHIPIPDDRDIVIGKHPVDGVVSRIMRAKRDQTGGYYPGSNPSGAAPQPQSQTMYAGLADMDFGEWVRTSQRGCQMMKGAWAVGIVIMVCFLISMGSLMGLWWKIRKQQKQDRLHRESKIEDNIQWST